MKEFSVTADKSATEKHPVINITIKANDNILDDLHQALSKLPDYNNGIYDNICEGRISIKAESYDSIRGALITGGLKNTDRTSIENAFKMAISSIGRS